MAQRTHTGRITVFCFLAIERRGGGLEVFTAKGAVSITSGGGISRSPNGSSTAGPSKRVSGGADAAAGTSTRALQRGQTIDFPSRRDET